MSIKFNDTQLVMLSAASQRNDHCLVPPTGPRRGQVQKAVVKLLEAGLVKEIRAKAGAPIWRRDNESEQTYALKLTVAGVRAIAAERARPAQGQAEERSDNRIASVDRKPEPRSDPAGALDNSNSGATASRMSPRSGAKIARIVELLQRGGGSPLAELVAVTGWLPHTTRAALTDLRKRGYAVVIDRSNKGRGSVYRIKPTEAGEVSVAPIYDGEVTGEAPPDQPELAPSPRNRRAA
jgi:hypothetical protein